MVQLHRSKIRNSRRASAVTSRGTRCTCSQFGTHRSASSPIWLTATDIDTLEVEHGIRLLPRGHFPRTLTGHIDFLQVRNGAVHILNYKPDASTNKPIAQLTLYALALARLADFCLFDIKCASFNEEEYCEFFPCALLARQN